MSNRLSEPTFESERWINWTESESEMSLRWDMMLSLRKKHELKGKTKTEVIELLGKPGTESNLNFGYYLGFSKRGINTGHLDIKFDEDGIATDYVVTDG